MDVPHLLEVRPDDFLRDAGPPVHVAGCKLLRRILAGNLHLQSDDLRLGGQVDQVVPVGMGVVDGEGTGDDPGDCHGVQPVNHAARLEDGEVAALPGERRRDAGHGYWIPPRACSSSSAMRVNSPA